MIAAAICPSPYYSAEEKNGNYINDKNGTLIFDRRVDTEDARSLLRTCLTANSLRVAKNGDKRAL